MSRASEELYAAILSQCPSHLSADQLLQLCRKKDVRISQATLYRALKSLESEGKIRRISLPDRDVYDGCLENHAHICCPVCGKIEDFRQLDLHPLLDQMKEPPLACDLLIYRVCDACAQSHSA